MLGATSDNITNFSSVDYSNQKLSEDQQRKSLQQLAEQDPNLASKLVAEHYATHAVAYHNEKTSDASIVNSGEFEARNDGVTPISNRRATSDYVTNFS